MNAIGTAILLFIAYFGYRGFQRGLVEEVGRLVGLVLAVILADRLTPAVALMLRMENEMASSILAFAGIFIGTLVAMAILTRTVRSLVELVLLGWLDRIGGTVFGILKSLLVLGVLIYVLQNFGPTRGLSQRMHEESAIFRQVVAVRDGMFKLLTLDTLLKGVQEKIEQVDPEDLVRPLLNQI